ncbi:hypothetical protein [Desulfobotulus mexicanus]|uniref:Uncharacterized protein n=1 Tax=Desulfobotulus mexicanus TaxID=2586642 RepID=A0A5Q4VFC6_9BACT|nr:hypothetical protein [Desulfobotulus mexicanus]TYT75673.1 hypothetical protein FIM25_04340 [Desulfobotulus mexicanus]
MGGLIAVSGIHGAGKSTRILELTENNEENAAFRLLVEGHLLDIHTRPGPGKGSPGFVIE